MAPETRELGGWAAAASAAALTAVDPVGTGGVCLRARAGPVREAWLELLQRLLPSASPLIRVPAGVDDGRLLGGLDLGASLSAGRRIVDTGLLAAADGGLLLVTMAERLDAAIAGRIAAAHDRRRVTLEREGLSQAFASAFGLCILDEGAASDEAAPAALLDRTAFHLDLDAVSVREIAESSIAGDDILRAQARLPDVTNGAGTVEALCEAAAGLGIASLRAPMLALAAARAQAALRGGDRIAESDLVTAVRLVLLPRATTLPADDAADAGADAEETSDTAEPDTPTDSPRERAAENAPQPDPGPAEEAAEAQPDASADASADPSAESTAGGGERVVQAAAASLPAGLLAQWREETIQRQGRAGRAGAQTRQPRRGRPVGVRHSRPTAGNRLNLAATLRAAVPWQRLRERPPGGRVAVRGEDFRVTRLKARTETATIFVVDASGSTALARLGEAKGAVELLLADCYIRRDEVGLIAFRGTTAEVLLPPSRSLVRAKRSLASLPGGGGTPLARGLTAAERLAEGERRKGRTPLLVLMTDGKANIGEDGSAGRAQAQADALTAARRLKAAGFSAILIDTSRRPQERAQSLAEAMGARYVALPRGRAGDLSQAVRREGVSAARS